MPSVLNVEEPVAEVAAAVPLQAEEASRDKPSTLGPALRYAVLLFLLTLGAVAINGYHPYAEDAGIYVAGIKQAADPRLYGSSAVFVTAYSKLSRFSSLGAWTIHSFHLKIESYLFIVQIATTWLLLYACFGVARSCFRRAEAVWGSVVLTSVCLSVPVAGSSLFMMDPYVTGRSFSTPLTLLAVVALLNGKLFRCALLAALVALFHPLMFIYSSGFLLLLWAVQRRSWAGVGALMMAALAAAEAVQYSQRVVVESPAYRAVVATRPYYFLCQWRWYELFGLAAPLMILAACAWLTRRKAGSGVSLAKTCVLAGLTSVAVLLLFARPSSHSHLVAALQTARPHLIIYYVLFLLLGGLAGQYVLKRSPVRWATLLLPLVVGLTFVQHETYSSSAHLELPWIANQNGWYRAFVWIRANTPRDSVVALDADYIHAPGEDGQGFRAIAERDALADFTKDGGVAAAFPNLAQRWMTEHLAQTGLDSLHDDERRRRLKPLHVSWIILERRSATVLPCPFQDGLVKVCQLR